jgi:hypothetical protein
MDSGKTKGGSQENRLKRYGQGDEWIYFGSVKED